MALPDQHPFPAYFHKNQPTVFEGSTTPLGPVVCVELTPPSSSRSDQSDPQPILSPQQLFRDKVLSQEKPMSIIRPRISALLLGKRSCLYPGVAQLWAVIKMGLLNATWNHLRRACLRMEPRMRKAESIDTFLMKSFEHPDATVPEALSGLKLPRKVNQ